MHHAFHIESPTQNYDLFTQVQCFFTNLNEKENNNTTVNYSNVIGINIDIRSNLLPSQAGSHYKARLPLMTNFCEKTTHITAHKVW